MKAKSRIAALAIASLMVIGMGTMTACGPKNTVIITGSSSVSPIIQKLAADYEKKNADVRILITVSDSTTGVTDTRNGRNDIGMVSRDLKTSETGVIATKLCDDGIVLIVNKEANIENATNDEVYNLYANGTAVGPINSAIAREEGSGTRSAFDDLVVNSEGGKLSQVHVLSNKVDTANSTGLAKSEIATSAAQTKMAYISLGSLDDTVKALKYNGIEATGDNVRSKSYKLARALTLIQKQGNDNAAANAFIEYILSPEGQSIVAANGYVAL